MINLTAKPEDDSLRIDKFICKNFDISFALAQKLIRQKKLKINGARPVQGQKISAGDEIIIHENLSKRKEKFKKAPSRHKLAKISSYKIFEDKNIFAINKPSGLATQGGSGIEFSLADFAENKKYHLVHRLDKDTSGVLLLAKNKEVADYLLQKFKDKEINKIYTALVLGNLKKEQGQINIPLKKKMLQGNEKVRPDFEDGKEAISNFKLIQNFMDHALVELSPITGRTHQLRVHMKELGHPILNDIKYGGPRAKNKEICKRLCLHAKNLIIEDYFGKKLEIFAPNFEF